MKKFLGMIFALLIAVPAAFGARPINPVMQAQQQRVPFISAPNLPGGGGAGTQHTPPANTPTTPPPPAYSVQNCMNDLSACVEGSLPGGISAMFELSMRTAVLSGMELCGDIVERCVMQARTLNDQLAYNQTGRSGVWHDFNSRVIQPAYFSMVMRNNGGLTPNQAERVCLLMDRNVHGGSFAAVGGLDNVQGSFGLNNVTNEFNQNIGQFNQQGGARPSDHHDPLGRSGVSQAHLRGHYGRWNAREGICQSRVAAYRSGNLITLNALGFGSEWGNFGNGAAEVWVTAGESFECKGGMFEGRILNQTATMAIVGVGGGALVGATTGAIIGAATNEARHRGGLATEYCTDDVFRTALRDAIRTARQSPTGPAGDWDAVAAAAEVQSISNISINPRNCRPVVESLLGGPFEDQINDILSEQGNWGTAGSRAVVGGLAGAGIGAAAGGIATAITTFIERNNVECRVGDGLDAIAYGRSGRVRTLREYYVDWALNLPETLIVNTVVQGADENERCVVWNSACNSIVTNGDCNSAAILLQADASLSRAQVNNACLWSNGRCMPNLNVSIARGICTCPVGQIVNTAGHNVGTPGTQCVNP